MKVLFICSGMHEAHKPFVEVIGADVYPVYGRNVSGFRRFIEAFKMAKEYPDYDVYLLEGGMPMFPTYLKKKTRKDITVIGLLADETFINLVERQPHYSFAETIVHRISARCLNGAIADSPLIKSYAEKVLNIPIKIARPPLSKDNYKKLRKVRPNLESNIIVSVGQPRYSIGMDVLVEQFKIAKREIPDLELWIIGKGHPKKYELVNGVKVLGFVKDLSNVFKESSLFVHAGRCSSYSVATVEAMRAGVPVVVSNMTGAMEIVEKVEEEFKRELGFNYGGIKFVQPLDRIAEGIMAYYSLDVEARRLLSKKYRRESEEFEPGKRAKHFREVFERLVEGLT